MFKVLAYTNILEYNIYHPQDTSSSMLTPFLFIKNTVIQIVIFGIFIVV